MYIYQFGILQLTVQSQSAWKEEAHVEGIANVMKNLQMLKIFAAGVTLFVLHCC